MRVSTFVASALRTLICILSMLPCTAAAISSSSGAASSGLMELPSLPAPAAPTTAPPPAAIAHPPVATPAPPPAPVPAAAAKPPVSSPATPTPALPPSTGSDPAVTLANNPEVILIPLRMTDTSMMFSSSDMKVIKPFLEIYDSTAHSEKTETPKEENDLTSLLQTLKTPEKDAPAPPAIPNLYLGSIVYYSASHWSVWIDGRKLVNTYNSPQNPLYVSRISRTEVELVWKPAAATQVIATWRERTTNGKNPIPGIAVDDHSGAITLLLRPNQTFVPQSLMIYEGLIKSDIPLPPQPTNAPDSISPFSLQPRGPRP